MLALTIGGLLGYIVIALIWLSLSFRIADWASEKFDDYYMERYQFYFLLSLIGGPVMFYLLANYIIPFFKNILNFEIV